MSEKHYRQIRTARANDVFGTIKRMLSYIMVDYKGRFILALLCVLVSSLTGVISSYFFTPLINNHIVPNIGVSDPDLSGFVRMLCIMGAIYASGVIASYTYKRLISIISTGMLNHLRKDLFAVMQKLPISFFDRHTHGEMMIFYTNDIDTMRPMVAETLPSLTTACVTLVGCFTMMAISNFRLMLLVLLMFIIMLMVTFFLAKNSRRYFGDLQRQISDINGYVEEMFSGQKVIKVFNHEEESRSYFRILCDRLYHNSVRTNGFASILMPVNANISYISYALVAVIGAKMYIDHQISLGVLTSFLLYVRQFAGPVSNLSQQFNGFMMALAGAERVFNLMDQDPELDEGKITLVNMKEENGALVETAEKTHLWAWKKPLENGQYEYIELKGDVRLNHVTFAYNPEKTVLTDVSLYAKPGQKIAFVGSTGAGKTTITNLINRFYDIQKGTITYDGIDIKDIAKDDLRRSIGMVLQDTNLFTGTVMDNIRYGRLDATDEECIAAAKLCNAHSFITRLPKGYQTELTANGANLSQGQRQLLNIARCAVADPPVMILDEATSSIDTHTEKLIEKGMDELMKGRTTFVIAHRLSTVRNSNAIIVLEHGEIIERGDHDDLLLQKGRYYQLYTGKAELD